MRDYVTETSGLLRHQILPTGTTCNQILNALWVECFCLVGFLLCLLCLLYDRVLLYFGILFMKNIGFRKKIKLKQKHHNKIRVPRCYSWMGVRRHPKMSIWIPPMCVCGGGGFSQSWNHSLTKHDLFLYK